MKKILILFFFFLQANVGCTVSDPEMMELLQEIKAQNDKLLEEVLKMKEQLSLLDGKYQVILASLADNKKELEALKSQIDSLKAQIAQQLIKIDQLSAQLTQQGADIIKLSQEIKELKASCEELKGKIEELLSGKSPVPTNGLIAWYPFNGNANDESGNGNNGTVNGSSLSPNRLNENNKAYTFNGSSSITFGKNLNLAPKNISVSTWIRIQSLGNEASSILRARFAGYHLFIQNNGKAYVDLNTSGNNGNVVSQNRLDDQKWHNIVFSFFDQKLSLYIDGVLQQSDSDIGLEIVYQLTGVSIGKDGDADKWFFNGQIDDVAIWNRGLTTEEISKIYNGEKF